MTSMPLTSRTMFCALMLPHQSKGAGLSVGGSLGSRKPLPPWRERRYASGLAVRRVAARHLLVREVLLGACLDHRLDDLLVGLHEVGTEGPLAAVPGLNAS